MRPITAGVWVVIQGRLGGSFEARKVTKVMASTFEYERQRIYPAGIENRRCGKSCVVFVGNKRDAEICQEQLVSGHARYKDEVRQAGDRWGARKGTIIASCESLTPD